MFFFYKDQQSKIEVVNKWIKEHKKYESVDKSEDDAAPSNSNDNAEAVVDTGQNETDVGDDTDDNYKTVDTDDNDPSSDSPEKYLKRRKSSRNLLRSSKRNLKKHLKEVDTNTSSLKTVNIYQSLEKQELISKQSVMYKELWPHENFSFLLLYFPALLILAHT